MSWLWAWMMAAPASRQRPASARMSSGRNGTFGLRSRVVMPLIAASMITGASLIVGSPRLDHDDEPMWPPSGAG